MKQEKETRKKTNAENRKVYLQEYFKTYDRPKKDNNSYEQMVARQKQDAMELSYTTKNMSDYALAKWSNIYHTNSKGNLSIDSKLKVGADIPKTINFKGKNIKLKDLKLVHIQKFYDYLYKKGLGGNYVLHYHANIRKALYCAMKLVIIPTLDSNWHMPESKSLKVFVL